MKTFFLSTLIGVLLITGGVFFDICIEKFSDEMLNKCNILEAEISLDGAIEKENEIEEYLKNKHLLLASIINHDHIDEIEICLSELRGYLEVKDVEEARVKCGKLKLLLERLPKEYGVSPENIL